MSPIVITACVLMLVLALSAHPSAAQEPCRFVLGFATLRDLVGVQKVGNCLESERFNVENGNGEQRTSGGLLVWRKIDNFTAFTDGSHSWINGPNGLESRPNAERFSWEKDPIVAPRAATAAAPAGSPAPLPQAAAAPAAAGTPAEVQAYLDWLTLQITAADDSRTTIGELTIAAAGNQALLDTPAWKEKATQTLTQMTSVGQRLQQGPGAVPAQVQPLDKIAKDLGADLVYISVEYAAGTDGRSAPRMQNAITRLNGLKPKTDAARTEIARVRGTGTAAQPASAAPAPVSPPTASPNPTIVPSPAVPPAPGPQTAPATSPR
jgi:hypothetical protein